MTRTRSDLCLHGRACLLVTCADSGCLLKPCSLVLFLAAAALPAEVGIWGEGWSKGACMPYGKVDAALIGGL